MPSIASLVAACVGGAMAIFALMWRYFRHRQVRRAVVAALTDPDEMVRASAVEIATSGGVWRYADVILSLAEAEQSEIVRRRIVEVVARNQWEPSGTTAVVGLRLWAQKQLDASAPRSTASDTAQSREPSEAHVMPDPRLAFSPTADRGEDTSATPEHDKQGKTRVLVSGAGGPAGVSVIRALRGAANYVIAVDSDPYAAGLRLADAAAIIPRADDDRFVDVLLEVARATGAAALVPTIAEEIVALGWAFDRLERSGLGYWIPDPAAVQRCIDKWEFAKTLVEVGISTPATSMGTADGVPGPWVVKPRFGRGSRDVHLIDNPDELPFVLARVPEPLIQSRLEGREFTADVLVGQNGDLLGAVPRWRLETRGGISTKGETFADATLVEELGRLLSALGLTGPANVQGFVGSNGRPSFTEVNPRFSGGLPLSLAAGADLVGEYLRGVLGGEPQSERLQFRPGVRMIRYFEELFEE